ncbi:aldo/keto reductase [Alkalibacter saccharofermentans]|uniref:Predicted oxidoreductase of the aldo/keto reductase family n=1 Tax=Alkalibacter saccharofermentans DSM 14828 TaxID=1120975 RepID=A0A1M4WFM8_9FIRM|nr:aldo/keto reductase [Alkalibacter saccharofermentans]SHE79883.1 Predicted oxidoreductase of the aldo/keto reductase family [Alkalibacter saccharofermentans DSM 14828]
MNKVHLGNTGIYVNKNGFGALPIQRITREEAKSLLLKAYDNGVDFFDTARMYSDSEEKIGYALEGFRQNIYIATKTTARDTESFWTDLKQSLESLKTGYVDLYQFHNPSFCPKPGDGTGLYEAMVEAKEKGLIRHIGITNHRLHLAFEAVESGLYEVLQFPFSYLANDEEKKLVNLCKNRQVGFIAMKALSGGLITNAKAAYAFVNQFDNVLPIWGIQKESELDEFISYHHDEPGMKDDIMALIDKDLKELSGEFCRGCGYCLPCPVNIDIPTSARMGLMLRRAPSSNFMTDEWKEKMNRVEDCIECGHCKDNCPYDLDTPKLLRENLQVYKTYL